MSVSRAGDVDGFSDIHSIQFAIDSTVPAADLSGETRTQVADSSNIIVVDWSEILDSDEVFRVHTLLYHATLSFPTTATAEGHAWCGFALSRGLSVAGTITDLGTAFASDISGQAVGIADVLVNEVHDDEILDWAELVGSAGFGDSTNGLGAGEDAARMFRTIPYMSLFGDGPIFDADDEIAVPHELFIDNVSDHAVNFNLGGSLHGEVIDI